MIWWLKRPGTVSIDQCVCQDDKLSGDGDEGDFGKFAVVSQAPIEVAQCRVVLGSGEGGEVEDVAYTLSPSFDAALPAALTHSPGDSGINGPIHPQPDRRPQARSHLSSSVNETVQAIYKGCEWRLRLIKSPPPESRRVRVW